MSTKGVIQSNINTQLASTSDITAAKHRGVLKVDTDSILENMYSKAFVDTDVTQSVFTLLTAGIATFNLIILKQGREVSCSMSITSLAVINQLGSFVTGERNVKTGATYYATGFNLSDNKPVGIEIRESGGTTQLWFTNALPISATVWFTITWTTNL
ncbi:MAG: hypothetical protein ACUZ8H_01375 [Candidatus Anammoxibacter sp.]